MYFKPNVSILQQVVNDMVVNNIGKKYLFILFSFAETSDNVSFFMLIYAPIEKNKTAEYEKGMKDGHFLNIVQIISKPKNK